MRCKARDVAHKVYWGVVISSFLPFGALQGLDGHETLLGDQDD